MIVVDMFLGSNHVMLQDCFWAVQVDNDGI